MMKEEKNMSDVRLIERWLPIAALSEESVRERRSMTALPPNYYLHVWWARRPLVASRAAILSSLLPEEANRADFLKAVGIHGDGRTFGHVPFHIGQVTGLSCPLSADLRLRPCAFAFAGSRRPVRVFPFRPGVRYRAIARFADRYGRERGRVGEDQSNGGMLL